MRIPESGRNKNWLYKELFSAQKFSAICAVGAWRFGFLEVMFFDNPRDHLMSSIRQNERMGATEKLHRKLVSPEVAGFRPGGRIIFEPFGVH